jgi:ERF superfamily protein
MNALSPMAATPAEPVLADSLLNLVARAMADPTIDVTKLESLIRIQRDILADDARLQFARAMSAAQGQMQAVVRDAANDQTRSKYARLETIDAAIRPIYVRNGFCLEFNSEPIDGPKERIVCEVSHAAGHAKKFQLDAAPDTAGPQGNANKTPLHGLGSTVSYLRRYLTCMVFNIVLTSDDNDGNRNRPVNDDGEVNKRAHTDLLYALLAECSADPTAVAANERAFLTKMGHAELRSLADAPPQSFARLKNALLTKRSIITKRAGERS